MLTGWGRRWRHKKGLHEDIALGGSVSEAFEAPTWKPLLNNFLWVTWKTEEAELSAPPGTTVEVQQVPCELYLTDE